MSGRSAGAALLVLAALAAAASASPAIAQRGRDVKSGSSSAPVAPAEPVRAAFAAATAPGLADTTRARLASFLARHGRHPLARDAHMELGLLAYARGDYPSARDAFRRARGPGGAEEPRYWEALSAFALGRPREARAIAQPLARVKKDAPRRWDAAYLVALSWAQEGRRNEALAAYRELFALPGKGGEAAALYQGVRLARELGRAEEAGTWRDRLMKGAPGSPEAASLLAEEKAASGARADSAAAREKGKPTAPRGR